MTQMSTCRLHSECKHEALFALRTSSSASGSHSTHSVRSELCLYDQSIESLIQFAGVVHDVASINQNGRLSAASPPHPSKSLSLSLSLSLSVTCRAGTLKRRVVQKPSISRHNVTRSERESDGGRTREEDTICSTGCGDQSETEEEEYSCHEPEVSRLLFHHESDEHCAVEFLVGVDWTRHRRGTMRVDSRERGRRRRK